MKKNLLKLLSILILVSTLSIIEAKANSDTQLAEAIKLYKAGNYVSCYQTLNEFVDKHPDNVVAYYYLAMSAAQAGKTKEAINMYKTVLALSSESSNIHKYAQRGKTCLEDSDKCGAFGGFASKEEAFILNKGGSSLSDEVKSQMEKLKLLSL